MPQPARRAVGLPCVADETLEPGTVLEMLDVL
jgi:hypothetical protein